MKGTNYQRYTLQSKQNFNKGIFWVGANVVLTRNEDTFAFGSTCGYVVYTKQAIPTQEQYEENKMDSYSALYDDVVNFYSLQGMLDDNFMKRYSENVEKGECPYLHRIHERIEI